MPNEYRKLIRPIPFVELPQIDIINKYNLHMSLKIKIIYLFLGQDELATSDLAPFEWIYAFLQFYVGAPCKEASPPESLPTLGWVPTFPCMLVVDIVRLHPSRIKRENIGLPLEREEELYERPA
ncbi:unnamed protein product [Vicia faba]|uniref:Uncharacterized protein n=1 Tax=Vicia faba TaxID=3906 RepID=A0AAV0Z980_VICFA|nr:unnamed protein product [Vicia faba]